MTISRSKLKCIRTVFLVVSTWTTLNLHTGFAQRPLRNINGIVTDQHLVPIKGAVVLVENEETDGVVSYITRADGRYSNVLKVTPITASVPQLTDIGPRQGI